MSPEQASATRIDQRSDVYAFGVLAYETLTGRLPFDGETPLATLMKHQSDAPLPPRRLRPELPPELEELVLRALVKRPEGRQQSMQEVAGELARIAAEPEVLRAPVFGTAVAPLLTSRSTDRLPLRSSARGGTMPLGDTLPLRDLAPPSGAPETPTRPSTRLRRDTRAEVEVVRRRRSQAAVAAVLGLLFVALLSGVVAALASRGGDGPRTDAPSVRTAEPPAVQVTASAPAGLPMPSSAPPPATASSPPPATGIGTVTEGPTEPAGGSVEPPPSVSAAAPPATAQRAAKGRPSRNPAGVGAKGASGENAPTGNDLLDPYGPTAR
jgi:eukaryotic-like serine/threonine-protein kinase